MDKPHILIWMTSMHLGGAERALIGLLHAFDYNRIVVDLFLNRHEGELMADIPTEVNLLPENSRYMSLAEPIEQTLKRGQVAVAASRLVGKYAAKRREDGVHRDAGIAGEYSHKYTKWLMPKINPEIEYDLAISFITPHYFVAEKVRAKKKIAWIHTDYSNIALDVPSQLNMWSKYDHIVSISDKVSEQFVKLFPSLKPRLIRIDNILPEKLIRRQAEEFTATLPEAHFKLLSIGRFSFPKNFDNIPIICSRLVEMGLDVSWSIIGYGGNEDRIQRSIDESGMQNHVKILGKQNNPYPYIRACDLYVQPSRYEGKAVTVREAQMLGKPVVITDFPTAKSQLEDGVDGVIVPIDNEECAEGILRVLKNKKQLDTIQQNCITRDYSNMSEVNKFYQMI